MTGHLFSFGHGYSSSALAARLVPQGWRITGTTREAHNADAIRASGVTPVIVPDQDIAPALREATHLLVCAAPDENGDPMLARYQDLLTEAAPHLTWVGYLSTTGVYGDHGGDWVDEDTALSPATRRGQMRVEAENAWTAFCAANTLPLSIFRLAGIYGPGRGPFAKVRAGTARRIIKDGQVFSRTHVEDIAQVLEAAINRPQCSGIFNVCDDDPAPPQDVIAYAAELLGLPLPEAVDFETAELSPMARSFYAESKKVRNDRIKNDLGVRLLYPDYKTGLEALLKAEENAG
ncbi:SDR family oxidoreductase [Celeribacter sp.]|uniref:SDR family oxidoreductase n=1 Tax=Celeribacter sp. TaxID=1890673 RepID=UPI003A9511B0